MNRRIQLMLTTVVVMTLGFGLPIGNAIAQQLQHVSYKTSADNTKYTQQHIIDVGDVPGHQVRIFEIHRTYPNNAPVINGMKLVEQWTRAMSDFTDNNGPATNYGIYVLENGDKFFVRSALVSQSTGGGKLSNMTAGPITGGTGKLAGIHGTVRTSGTAEPKAGINETQTDIEYSIGN
jgi:hypothetical protein